MKKIAMLLAVLLLLTACHKANTVSSETVEGKWTTYINAIKGDLTLNIYSEGDQKVLFISSEEFKITHYPPRICEITDNTLEFTMNSDERHLITINLEMSEEGSLKGKFTQHGNTVNVVFKKISDIPDKLEDLDPFNGMTGEDRVNLLKAYAIYEAGGEKPVFTVKTGEKSKYEKLITEYGLDTKTEGLKDTALMTELLNWVSDNFKHNGNSELPPHADIYSLIDYCEEKGGINCRGLSLILAEVLRAYGIDARHVTCMPMEEQFIDCHVVVHAYSKELNQWIMLDPSFRVMLMDEEGNYIDLSALRQSYIDGRRLTAANGNAGRNGQPFNAQYYFDYMAKNTFRFEMDSLFDSASDGMNNKTKYNLLPKGYDVIRSGAVAIYDSEKFWAIPE